MKETEVLIYGERLKKLKIQSRVVEMILGNMIIGSRYLKGVSRFSEDSFSLVLNIEVKVVSGMKEKMRIRWFISGCFQGEVGGQRLFFLMGNVIRWFLVFQERMLDRKVGEEIFRLDFIKFWSLFISLFYGDCVNILFGVSKGK